MAEAVAIVMLSAAWKRTLLSGVVPGPRDIVARQLGVVSSFLMCLVWLFLLDVFSSCSGRRMNLQPSQAKVLTGGGDLCKAQVDVPVSVSHSCV